MIQNSKAFQCFRPHVFHNSRLISRLELLSSDDRTCCSSHAACSEYSGFDLAIRSRKTLSRDVKFRYFRPFPVKALRTVSVQSTLKSYSFAEIADGVKRNINRSVTQTAFEICVFAALLSLEFCDVVLRVGGLLLRIISTLVQLVLKFGKGFLFHRRFKISNEF